MTRVFSGIQPTGQKHLGNYIGAIRHWLADQDLGEAFYCVVDLHSISVPYDAGELRENTLDTAATLMAAGPRSRRLHALRPERTCPSTPRRTWLLGVRRDVRRAAPHDAVQGEERPGAVLGRPLHLSGAAGRRHPALRRRRGAGGRGPAPAPRAGARHRPALQRRFGETFTVPEAAHPAAAAAGSWTCRSPTRKMSTTARTRRAHLVLDPPDVIAESSARRSPTRAARCAGGEDKPGVAKLIEIMAVATGGPPDAIEARYDGAGYGKFKEDVAEAVEAMIGPVREPIPRAALPTRATCSRCSPPAPERAQALAARRNSPR